MPGTQRLNPMQMTMSGVFGKRTRLLKGRLASKLSYRLLSAWEESNDYCSWVWNALRVHMGSFPVGVSSWCRGIRYLFR